MKITQPRQRATRTRKPRLQPQPQKEQSPPTHTPLSLKNTSPFSSWSNRTQNPSGPKELPTSSPGVPTRVKNIAPKSPVDIRLMQGPPDKLKPIETLAKGPDSSTNSFKWLVPTTLAPGKGYTIRITQAGKLDTYSHYFEVVSVGDKQANKRNVGVPLGTPRKGDVPQPLNKGPIYQPANPFPTEKPAAAPVANNPASPSKPGAAKLVVNGAATSHEQNANILAFAMTLFGAVYFL